MIAISNFLSSQVLTLAFQAPADENVVQRIWRYINHKFTVGNFEISVASLVIGLIVFVAAIIVSRSIRAFIESRMARHARLDPGIRYTVLRLIHYLVITVGVLFALKTSFNLDLTTLAVVFTALSVGIGFGLQFIAGDIASGFILLFERPVRVGDFITISGPDNKLTEGRVQSINLRTTIVMTNDQIAAIVPNSKLVNQNLINWSYGDRRSRIAIPIGVAYESDVDLVTKTLKQAAEGVEFVVEDPKPRVQFLGFGDYALNFRLLIWTNRPRRRAQIRSDINSAYNVCSKRQRSRSHFLSRTSTCAAFLFLLLPEWMTTDRKTRSMRKNRLKAIGIESDSAPVFVASVRDVDHVQRILCPRSGQMKIAHRIYRWVKTRRVSFTPGFSPLTGDPAARWKPFLLTVYLLRTLGNR